MTDDSTQYATSNPIEDYKERRIRQMEFLEGCKWKTAWRSSQTCKCLVQIAKMPEPPLRLVAGAVAVGGTEYAGEVLKQQAGAMRELSTLLSFEN